MRKVEAFIGAAEQLTRKCGVLYMFPGVDSSLGGQLLDGSAIRLKGCRAGLLYKME